MDIRDSRDTHQLKLSSTPTAATQARTRV
jgi:hypothetical protein